MSLKDLPADARPREKLLARGAGALSDAELLALLLRTGTAGRGVLQMAQELLDDFGGMAGLLHAGADDLKRIKGLGGSAKRAELIAVLELARRALAEQLKEKPALDSASTVKQYLQLHLGQRPHEVFAALFLDAQHRLLALEELFRGTLTQTSVYPRVVVLRALHHHAAPGRLRCRHAAAAVCQHEARARMVLRGAQALRRGMETIEGGAGRSEFLRNARRQRSALLPQRDDARMVGPKRAHGSLDPDVELGKLRLRRADRRR